MAPSHILEEEEQVFVLPSRQRKEEEELFQLPSRRKRQEPDDLFTLPSRDREDLGEGLGPEVNQWLDDIQGVERRDPGLGAKVKEAWRVQKEGVDVFLLGHSAATGQIDPREARDRWSQYKKRLSASSVRASINALWKSCLSAFSR